MERQTDRYDQTNCSCGEYRLDTLFQISTAKGVNKNEINLTNNGKYDFIGRSSVNYGVQGSLNKMNYEPNPANTFSLVQVGETCCLFRKKEWYASQNIFILQPLFEKLIDTQLFITAVINKALIIYGKEYSSYPTLKDLPDISIKLPSTPYGEPDWDYMERFIKAIQKLSIKNVVEYKDKMIDMTKKVVYDN